MPDTPHRNSSSRGSAPSTSSYLSAELGALSAFLKSRTRQNDSSMSIPSASAGAGAGKPVERVQIEIDLAKRAHRDAAFKTALLTYPTATVADALEAYDVRLLDTVIVHVHEESPYALHLVLPMLDNRASDELGDEMLDLVAGGASGEEGAHTAPAGC